MSRCAKAVAGILDRPLLDVIFGIDDPDAAETLQQTRRAQAAIFAVEMGLAGCGSPGASRPDVVIGHSVSQYAAACVARVFSLEDGARLLAERGRLFGDLPGRQPDGGDLRRPEAGRAAQRPVPEPVGGRLQQRQHRTVRTSADLEQAVARLSADGVRCDWLDTSPPSAPALLDRRSTRSRPTPTGSIPFSCKRFLICNRTGAASDAPPPSTVPTGVALAPASPNSPGRGHAGPARLHAAGGSRPPAGAHRRGAAGLAGHPQPPEGPRLAAQERRRPPPDHQKRWRAPSSPGMFPTSAPSLHDPARRSTCRPTPSSIGSTGSTTASRSGRSTSC